VLEAGSRWRIDNRLRTGDALAQKSLDDAERIQDLEGARLDPARSGLIGRPVATIDDPTGDPVAAQLGRREQPGRAGADHEYLGFGGRGHPRNFPVTPYSWHKPSRPCNLGWFSAYGAASLL